MFATALVALSPAVITQGQRVRVMAARSFSTATNRPPLVSVIMANYNCADYLAAAIASAQRQTVANIEIIVADDGSTDSSVAIVTRLMADDARIRLIRIEPNGGPAAARNRAIAAATGDWIAILDSDDLMHQERLAVLVQAAHRDGADIVADNLFEFSQDHQRPSRRLLHGKWGRAPFWVNVVDYIRLNRLYGRGPNLGYLKPLIRASIVRDANAFYDETLSIGEDYDLVMRLLCAGKTMRIYPRPLYYYRTRDSSISHRLNQRALEALRASGLKVRADIGTDNPTLIELIDLNIDSIEVALAYESLLTAIKGKHLARALEIARSRPRAALLLRHAIAARLHRLFRALWSPAVTFVGEKN